MGTSFQKTSYRGHEHLGFLLNHTSGPDAEGSTLSYLHHTTQYTLICLLRGKGSIKVEGHHYDLFPGDMVLLNPTELYYFTVCSEEYHERIVLHVSPTFLDRFPLQPASLFAPFSERSKGVGNLVPAETAQTLGASPCLNALFELVRTPEPINDLLAACKVVELLSLFRCLPMPGSSSAPAPGHTDPLVIRVLDYLNLHFREEITLSSVAKEFGITTSHLSHRFKDHTGMSLWNYVVLRRLHAFNNLIPNRNSIEDACYQVGFQNYSNFFRLYKKHMGLTPAQYKKQLTQRP